MAIANPWTNRLPGHSECHFRRTPASVAVPRDILHLNFREEWPYIVHDEIRILKSTYGHATAAEIAQHLKRSVGSVNTQIAKLGLTIPQPGAWTPEEKERLRTLYGRHSLKEMAEQPGRSVCAVRIKITELTGSNYRQAVNGS